MSMAPAGALTRTMRARNASTAPAISSTVSPRTRSAIRKAPLWAGVTSPESRVSKAWRASSRLSETPVATLAMKGLKASIGVPSTRSCGAPGLVPARGDIEEVAHHGRAMLGEDALGVELHPVQRQPAVRHAHDETVLALGSDGKVRRAALAGHDER